MASVSTDKNGFRRILFAAPDGSRRTVYLGQATKKSSNEVKIKIEALVTALTTNVSPDKEVADWLAGLKPAFYRKLVAAGLASKRIERERLTLGAFLDSFISDRSDVKPATATVCGHTRRCLLNYFGASKPLDEISQGDADDWRRYLARTKPANENEPAGEGLADNTVKRRCGIARQFFRTAKRRKLIAENPFADMRGIAVKGKPQPGILRHSRDGYQSARGLPGHTMAAALCLEPIWWAAMPLRAPWLALG